MTAALAASLGDRLAERGLTLAVAESCTGGMISALLTEREGASRYLLAGLTTYSNEAKTGLLGVDPEVLSTHGAVSEAVARAMAEGARRVTGADAAVAVTGVAGPGGGSPGKPVGTVWIAASLAARTVTEHHRFAGDRAAVRSAAVRSALELLDSLLTEA